jgi:2'-5' RNA ligase
MVSSSTMRATPSQLRDHWVWRPEWTPARTCLYWYLTFRDDEITRTLGDEVLSTVRDTAWLDDVPPEWRHVTVTDIGFTDELEPADVEHVRSAVADEVADEERLRLTLGPVQTFASAVVVATGPLDRLRTVQQGVRRATSAALGARHADVHRHLFWPHLSLGYVNRPVDEHTASRFRQEVPAVEGRVDVDAVTLVAVTRRDHGYRWDVEAEVDLTPGRGSTA